DIEDDQADPGVAEPVYLPGNLRQGIDPENTGTVGSEILFLADHGTVRAHETDLVMKEKFERLDIPGAYRLLKGILGEFQTIDRFVLVHPANPTENPSAKPAGFNCRPGQTTRQPVTSLRGAPEDPSLRRPCGGC